MIRVSIVGKELLDYTSKKTGKPVKGTVVHAVYEKKGVDGMAAKGFYVPETKIAYKDVKVGIDADFVLNEYKDLDRIIYS